MATTTGQELNQLLLHKTKETKRREEKKRKEIFTGHYNFIRKLQYLLAAGRAQQNNNYNNSLKAIQANYRLAKVWAQ